MGIRSIGWCLVMSGLLAGSVRPAAAQLSPGPLARAHASLEGTRQCLSCHPVGRKEAMDGACLACHGEIAWLRQEGRGLHAKEARARCATCHPDHLGRDFSLIAWNSDSLARFNHARAGWAIEGGHREVKCDACHAARYQVSPATRRAPQGAKGRWTGLERSCTSCHEDIHRDRFRVECTECHDLRAWAPAPRFDHDRSEYPLTGRHATVKCEQCHAPRPAGMKAGPSLLDPALPALRFAECSACHKDPHQGRLGPRCAECHVTAGFFERPAAGRFDHTRTRYPLEGRHLAVRCAACHPRGTSRTTLAYAVCSDCHRPKHEPAWATRPAATRCESCHDVAGFKPSPFGPDRHRAGRCTECHAEVHGTQPPGTAVLADCVKCHGVEEWQRSAYPTADHAATGLPLEGRHATVACAACHGLARRDLPALARTAADGQAGIRFMVGKGECTSCHQDVHRARYGSVCTPCHDARAWRPAAMSPAEHERRGFVLAGAHLAVPCADCHQGLGGAGGAALLGSPPGPSMELSTKGRACAACHADPHGAQFAPRQCEACHGDESFRPAPGFDHARAGFVLDGAHARVACGQCHRAPAAGQPVRYRGIPVKCEGCHAAGTRPVLPGGRA